MAEKIISFQDSQILYEPYPVAYFCNFVQQGLYEQLMEQWPQLSLFKSRPKLGTKYSLSETNNGKNYRDFVQASPPWNRFHSFVKSDDFIESIIDYLKLVNIDLDIDRRIIVSRKKKRKPSLVSRFKRRHELNARFEFSMMDCHGGSILPHTDAPHKLITLVMSAVDDNEWNSEWGGGTQICVPLDRSLLYNQKNKYLQFEDVQTIREFPFVSNQCICFIKTYNSWHQVSPLRGPEGGPMRRTLTINIEKIT